MHRSTSLVAPPRPAHRAFASLGCIVALGVSACSPSNVTVDARVDADAAARADVMDADSAFIDARALDGNIDSSVTDARDTLDGVTFADVVDIVDAGPALPPIYYPVTRHTVVQDVTMIPLIPMVTITGATYAIAPALPAGLSFDTATGAISGRPTGVSPATDYRVTATAPGGDHARVLTLEVRTGAPSDLTYTTLAPTYVRNVAIPSNVPAYVGSRVTFTVSPALPPGLRLGATSGQITGTPTGTAGTTMHTVTATNAYGSTTRTLPITIANSAPTPTVVADLVPRESAPPLMYPGIHDAGPPLVGTGIQVPFPWFADPCDLGSFGLTPDGTGLRMRLQDGCRWHQNYDTYYPYARVELGLSRSLGGSSFPADVESTIEWRGHFVDPLPAPGTRDRIVAPFQLHNNNGVSPMWAIIVNLTTRNLEFDIHRPDGSSAGTVMIAPYASFLGTSRTIRMVIVPSGTMTGRIAVSVDGVVAYSATNVVTSPTPGEDYLKFGLYDWSRAIVDPAQPERGRTFEMVTEVIRVTR